MKTLDQTVRCLNKTEGRDKILKVLQYGSRFVMWFYSYYGNTERADQFRNLFLSSKEARSIFRFAKCLNEISFIINRIRKGKGEHQNEIVEVLSIFSRIWYAIYWCLDNLRVLSSLKLLNNNAFTLQQGAMTFWLIALITNFIVICRLLIQNYILICRYRNNPTKKSELRNLRKQNSTLYLNLLKIIGNLLPAGQESELFQKIFDYNLNDGIVGIGGLCSGVIAAYQAF